jgi:integrase
MSKRKLTDRGIRALKPAKSGTLYDVMDVVVPGFGVRVSESGRRTFILIARFPGNKSSARRKLGVYGAVSLEEARTKAREWLALIQRGTDPKAQEERQRREELRKQQTTFASVADDFIQRHVKGQRRGRDTEREIRKELVDQLGSRPISDISRDEVVRLIEQIADRPAPYLAHIVLGHLRSLFNWAINRGTYGLEISPCDRVKPAAIIGPKVARQRVLEDAELASLWRASETLDYPFGPLYKLLLLTGARKSEVAESRWAEFDLQKRVWRVPPERFKSNSTHLVPLSKEAIAVIETLPRFAKGEHLFSTTFGEKPVSGFSKAKTRLDEMMTEDLGSPPAAWVLHDIRRTVRTRLASLRVPDMVAEMIIGHGRKGLQRVYDQHSYEAEMRDALELWAGRLRDIANPPPENVVELRAKA